MIGKGFFRGEHAFDLEVHSTVNAEHVSFEKLTMLTFLFS